MIFGRVAAIHHRLRGVDREAQMRTRKRFTTPSAMLLLLIAALFVAGACIDDRQPAESAPEPSNCLFDGEKLHCSKAEILQPDGTATDTLQVAPGTLVALLDGQQVSFVFVDGVTQTFAPSEAASIRAVALAVLSVSTGSPLTMDPLSWAPVTTEGDAGVDIAESVSCSEGALSVRATNNVQRWCRVMLADGAGKNVWLPPASSLADRLDWINALSNLWEDPSIGPGNVRTIDDVVPASAETGIVLCGWARPAIAAFLPSNYIGTWQATDFYLAHGSEIIWAGQSFPVDAAKVAGLDAAVAYWSLAKAFLPIADACVSKLAGYFVTRVTTCAEEHLTAWDGGSAAHNQAFGLCGLHAFRELLKVSAECAVKEGVGAALEYLEKYLGMLVVVDGTVALSDIYLSASQVMSHDIHATWKYPLNPCPTCADGTQDPACQPTIPTPPAPSLNLQIPADVTYHRIYDFTGPDTCSSCTDKAADPYGMCANPGFEFDIERRVDAADTDTYLANSYACVENTAAGFFDCFKEYECIWKPGSIQPEFCKSNVNEEPAPDVLTCTELAGIGIQVGIPPGDPGVYGYNVGIWPREPHRRAFKVGTSIYTYAQFFLPHDQDVTARAGIDCTPTSDPNAAVKGVHTQAWTEEGVWHEVLIPHDPIEGDFETVEAATQNCNAWIQCVNAGVWQPNAGDAHGGSCIVSRLEVAGYRDFCDFDKDDLVLEVDGCEGCLLHHGITEDGTWAVDEPGIFDGLKTRWFFSNAAAIDSCKQKRQFNVRLAPGDPVGDWLIDDDWLPNPPAIHVRKDARWLFVDQQTNTVLSTVPVACNMVDPNAMSLGHHGSIFVDTGYITPIGAPDLPCSQP